MIIDELIKQAENLAKGEKISQIRVGPGYTGVLLESGFCGLAATLLDFDLKNPVYALGLGEEKLSGLIRQAKSPDLITAATGLAAINALFAKGRLPFKGGDCSAFLPLQETDTVGVVGAFLPVIDFLKAKVKKVYVFENRENKRQPGFLPQEEESELLPHCDLLLVTASSLVNHSLDQVLSFGKNARFKALIGASTPFAPAIFKKYGFKLLSGIKITDPQKAMEVIAYGGTFELKTATQKVNLLL